MSRQERTFDSDPRFQDLRRIREDEGYDGPLDQDLNRVDPTGPRAAAAGVTLRVQPAPKPGEAK